MLKHLVFIFYEPKEINLENPDVKELMKLQNIKGHIIETPAGFKVWIHDEEPKEKVIMLVLDL